MKTFTEDCKFIVNDYGTLTVYKSEYDHYRNAFILDEMVPLSWDDYCQMRERALIDEVQSTWSD